VKSRPKDADKTKGPKNITWFDPQVIVGKGKNGPIDLVIYKHKLHVLKKIPKMCLETAKRMEHAKNEKKILTDIKEEAAENKANKKLDGSNFCVEIVETFLDPINLCFLFEYLPGQDLFWVLKNENNLKLSRKVVGSEVKA
jgi:serine/threonine protein kinase